MYLQFISTITTTERRQITMVLSQLISEIMPHLEITDKTRANYESAYRVNLAPKLSNKHLDQIDKNDIISAIANLPPQTKYQTLMVARTIFREAVERELVGANPAATIKPPRITVKPAKFLTWEELSALNFGKQHKRILFLALHGLRYGEAAALTAADIYDDLVHITKSKHGATKTKAGVRNVPLVCQFEPFALNQKSIARALRPHGVTVHSLRKTYAYLLKTSGVHVTTAQKLMGHSDPVVTLKIYTLVKDEEIAASGKAVTSYIEKSI